MSVLNPRFFVPWYVAVDSFGFAIAHRLRRHALNFHSRALRGLCEKFSVLICEICERNNSFYSLEISSCEADFWTFNRSIANFQL